MRACVHADGSANLTDINNWFKSRPFLFHFFNDILAEVLAFFDVVAIAYHVNIAVRIIAVFFYNK